MEDLPNIEDYWKGAESLLDKHYKAKRRRIYFFRFTVALLAIVGIAFFSLDKAKFKVFSSNKDKKPEANKNRTLLHSKGNVSSSWNAETTKQTQIKIYNSTFSTTKNNLANVANKGSQINVIAPFQVLTKKQTQLKLDSSISSVTVNTVADVAKKESAKIENEKYENSAINNLFKNEKDLPVEKISETQPNELTVSANISNYSKKENIAFQLLTLRIFLFLNNNIEHEISMITMPINNLITTPDDYTIDKNKLDYSIGLYYGIQQVNKKLNGNSENIEYVARRTKEEEKTNHSIYGLSFTITKNKLQLKTGLEYNTIGEKNNYETVSKQWQVSDLSKWNTYTKQVTVVDTVYHFGIKSYRTNYKTVADSSYQSQYDSIFTNTKNNKIAEANTKTKLSYIEIPSMIGYQFNKNKFAITPLIGFSAGYLVAKSGMYVNKTLTNIENISDNKNIKNFMLNYCFQLQLCYNINNKFSLYAAPQYKANAISVTNKSFGVNTFYKSYGALIGFNYKL